MIEAKRLYEMRTGEAAGREELLQVAQRDSCFGGHRGRANVRIGEGVSDDLADAVEQLVCVCRDRRRTVIRKKRSQQVIDSQLQVGLALRRRSVLSLRGVPHELDESAARKPRPDSRSSGSE